MSTGAIACTESDRISATISASSSLFVVCFLTMVRPLLGCDFQHALRVEKAVLKNSVLDSATMAMVHDVAGRIGHHAATLNHIVKRVVHMAVQPSADTGHQ